MPKAKNNEKLKALKSLVGQMNKKFGSGDGDGDKLVHLMSDADELNIETHSTGSILLDMAIGGGKSEGGFPKGRITEVYWPEASGKTTLTLYAAKKIQEQGGSVAFIDVEQAFNPDLARAIGLNMEDLIVAQPDHGEQAIEMTKEFVNSNLFDMVIVDSVSALMASVENEADMEKQQMGVQARLMSKACRVLTPLVRKSKTALVFINQLRFKIGVMFGNPETTSGGNALKFYASLRLDIRRKEKVERTINGSKKVVGSKVRVKVVKNKLSNPFGEAVFTIMFDSDAGIYGIDNCEEMVDFAIEHNLFEKKGNSFYLPKELGVDKEKVVGQKQLKAVFDTPEKINKLKELVHIELEKKTESDNSKYQDNEIYDEDDMSEEMDDN